MAFVRRIKIICFMALFTAIATPLHAAELVTPNLFDTRTILLGMLILIALVGIAVVGSLMWNHSVRRMVRRQNLSLRNSEARFRAIVENQTEVISRSLPYDHTLTFVNQAYCRRYGKTPDELIGTSFMDYVPEAERAEIHSLLATLSPQNPVIHVQNSIINSDGEMRWHQWTNRAIFDDEGNITEIQAVGRDITERKRAEVALQDSEARLSDAIESITDGFVYYDAEQRLVHCNSKYREFYPWIEDVLVPGARLADVARIAAERGQDAEPIANVEYWVEQRLKDFTTGRQRYEQHLRDGRWVLCSENRTSDGGIVGIRTDITERKRAEVALQESEARLRDAVESISEGFVLYDADNRFVLCNSRYLRFYPSAADVAKPGAKREDVARAVFESGALPGSAENVEGWMEKRFRHHRAAEGSHEMQLADGRWLRTTERKTSSGGTVGIRTDITELKRAADMLLESEQRYRLLVEASPDAILVGDEDGVIVFANSTAVGLFGADSVHQLIGMSTLDTVHPDDRPIAAELVQEVLRGTPNAFALRRRLRLDGSDFYSESRGVPFTWEGDPALLIVIHDITERRQTEEELRQAQKMEAVGQLTGGIAHDFNNLLTVIQGNVELAAERLGDDNDIHVLLERASKASVRGGILTHRLLAFSRRQTLMPDAIDVGKLLDDMIDLVRRTLGANIEIDVVSDGETWRCEADPSQLENAILNLSINARDAMPGGGTLTIAARNFIGRKTKLSELDLSPGEYVSIALSDTGSGMPREVVEKVFEPFYTTKGVGQGSGLGLSMVYGFIKQSGGDVTVDSTEGVGTTVTMYLPKSVETSDAAQSNEDESEPRACGEKVLVVEDDADVRALTVSLLDELGYKTVEVNDGKTAIATLKNTPDFDLLLTDVMLPGGKSGHEIAREANRQFPDIAILLVSGYAPDVVLERSLSALKTEILKKPFRRIDLARKVRYVLDNPRA